MMQTPVNYCTTQVPTGYQPSYNAVKIDIHNPKVTDAPQYPSAYQMPTGTCYGYPQMPIWGCPCPTPMGYPMPMPMPITMPMPQPMPQPVPVTTQPVQTVPVAPQPVPVTTQPVQTVPVVPAPVPPQIQQVINNGVPNQQTIQQTPQGATQTINNPAVTNPMPQPAPATVPPQQTMPVADITPVLRGLQSKNIEEQSQALNIIGEAAENPQEVKKYLETSVLDSLLGILNADVSGLATATPEQIAARTKMVNNQTLTDAETNLAMTLSPQEAAIQNKQHALYSISILQKALANTIEEKTNEKLSIEKLPAIDQVVNVIKSNPNPILRASAIVALVHLDKPEYKPILSEIFQLAQTDQDPNVKQVATEALAKINGEQPQAK